MSLKSFMTFAQGQRHDRRVPGRERGWGLLSPKLRGQAQEEEEVLTSLNISALSLTLAKNKLERLAYKGLA
jgi:hypothetical protein